MKLKQFFLLGMVIILLLSCASNPTNISNKSPISNLTMQEDIKTSPAYFTGTGGKGMTLGILVPESEGLNENQAYIPRMVQGSLVSNFSKFSAITVLDRVSLDKVITETLDPTYTDSLDIVRLGHVVHAGYMMTGNIMRTSTGYTLQLNVSETAGGATIASYSGTSTVAQFDDFSAIHQASKELLAQMGVELTNAAVNELGRASSRQTVNAQASLAQGINAQQKGTIVEAMAYYYDAVSFDSSLLEAAGRLNTLSSTVTSGNIGENVRNEIQQRNEWVKTLREAEVFFSKHLPFELVYSNSLTQGSGIDYNEGTVDLISYISLIPSENSLNVINNILTGLEATGKRIDWGLGLWPIIPTSPKAASWKETGVLSGYEDSRIFSELSINNRRYSALESIIVDIILTNELEKVIARTEVPLMGGAVFPVMKKQAEVNKGDRMTGYDRNYIYEEFVRPNFGSNYYRYFYYDRTKLEMGGMQNEIRFTVNANDITDNLTIKIASVDGINVAENPNYIRITAK